MIRRGEGEVNDATIKFETKVIKPNLCDYSDAYILFTGIILNVAANTVVAFKNCGPFHKCIVHINDEHLETAENLDIVMPMYNLLEYSDNYEKSSLSLYQFKRDEIEGNQDVAAVNNNDVVYNSSSFKYKSTFIDSVIDDTTNSMNNVKIVVPLKYLSNFFRSLDMPLINCKIHLDLSWYKNCVLTSANAVADSVKFKITETKLYGPIVTLPTKDNANLTKLLNEGFKRSVQWNEYKVKHEKENANNTFSRLLDASFQGVNRLFVLAFNNVFTTTTAGVVNDNVNKVKRDSYRKYYLPRVKINNYNIMIDGRNFYDQPIGDEIKKYDEIRKIALGKGDDYSTGCLLEFSYFRKIYQLIAIDLSKQKELDADLRAIQQIEFNGELPINSYVCTILEKSKETILEFYKGTAKRL